MSKKHFSWLVAVTALAAVVAFLLPRETARNGEFQAAELLPELAAVVGAERFLTEIRTTANLQHPNILPLFDSGEADGLVYYVAPHFEGESLRRMLDRERQLPVDAALRIAIDVADGLDHAHRAPALQGVPPDPGVQQRIAGATVEAGHDFATLEQRDVGDATDVDDDTVIAGMPECGIMECRHQRRTLSAGVSLNRTPWPNGRAL